jgi:hydantoinase/carbamoylase family amidase
MPTACRCATPCAPPDWTRSGLPLGIVHHVVGLVQAAVRLEGRADHAGTTPMPARRDALRAAAVALERASAAAEAMGPPAVLTCGRLSVAPGVPNVVVGAAELTVDVRHTDAERLRTLLAAAREAFAGAAAAAGVRLNWQERHAVPPTPLDARLCALLAEAASALGVPYLDMASGAGHDAQVLARHLPAAMLFIPCRDGRSHCPEEYASPEDCARGAAVLREAIRRCAS